MSREMINPLIKLTVAVLQYCSQNQSCKMIVCDSFILDKESSTEFVLLGEVQFRNLKERAAVRNNNTHKQHPQTENTSHIPFKVMNIYFACSYFAEYSLS